MQRQFSTRAEAHAEVVASKMRARRGSSATPRSRRASPAQCAGSLATVCCASPGDAREQEGGGHNGQGGLEWAEIVARQPQPADRNRARDDLSLPQFY